MKGKIATWHMFYNRPLAQLLARLYANDIMSTSRRLDAIHVKYINHTLRWADKPKTNSIYRKKTGTLIA